MKRLKKYRSFLFLPLLLLLSGCYDMTVQVTGLPGNTPPSEPIYISGNFNNWDPGDANYVLVRNSDSIYEVKLPRGIGEIEYKFTRGDWSTVEKDPCGFEISNRSAFYGDEPIIHDTVRSWNDLPKPDCPSITIIIESVPENTPENAVFYIAANFNGWDPGSRYWMFAFSQGSSGEYYVDVPMINDDVIEFKVTRGDWGKVECDASGNQIDNRVFRGQAGDVVRIDIAGWIDKF